MTKNFNYIYSETIGCMIPKGFIRKSSGSDDVVIMDEHFTWSECDAVYWSDDVDGKYFDYDDTLSPFISPRSGRRIDFIFD